MSTTKPAGANPALSADEELAIFGTKPVETLQASPLAPDEEAAIFGKAEEPGFGFLDAAKRGVESLSLDLGIAGYEAQKRGSAVDSGTSIDLKAGTVEQPKLDAERAILTKQLKDYSSGPSNPLLPNVMKAFEDGGLAAAAAELGTSPVLAAKYLVEMGVPAAVVGGPAAGGMRALAGKTLLGDALTGSAFNAAATAGGGFAPNVAGRLEKTGDLDTAIEQGAKATAAETGVAAVMGAPLGVGPNTVANIAAKGLVLSPADEMLQTVASNSVLGEETSAAELAASGLLGAMSAPIDIAGAHLGKEAKPAPEEKDLLEHVADRADIEQRTAAPNLEQAATEGIVAAPEDELPADLLEAVQDAQDNPMSQEEIAQAKAEAVAADRRAASTPQVHPEHPGMESSDTPQTLDAALPDSGRSLEASANRNKYSNPNDGELVGDQVITIADNPELVGKPVSSVIHESGKAIGIGVESEQYPEAYRKAAVASVNWMMNTLGLDKAKIFVQFQTLPEGRVAAIKKIGGGGYVLNPANLTHFSDPGKMNEITQAEAAYSLAHEVGHVFAWEALQKDMGMEHRMRFDSLPQNELLGESFIASQSAEIQPMLREYDALKARVLDGSMSAQEFMDTWLGPAKHAWGMRSKDGKQTFGQNAMGKYRRFETSTARSFAEAMGGDILSPQEYFAEQLSRYAHDRKLLEKTELGTKQFFGRVLAKLREFFAQLKKQKAIKAGTSFTDFVDAMAARVAANGVDSLGVNVPHSPTKPAAKPRAKAKPKTEPAVPKHILPAAFRNIPILKAQSQIAAARMQSAPVASAIAKAVATVKKDMKFVREESAEDYAEMLDLAQRGQFEALRDLAEDYTDSARVNGWKFSTAMPDLDFTGGFESVAPMWEYASTKFLAEKAPERALGAEWQANFDSWIKSGKIKEGDYITSGLKGLVQVAADENAELTRADVLNKLEAFSGPFSLAVLEGNATQYPGVRSGAWSQLRTNYRELVFSVPESLGLTNPSNHFQTHENFVEGKPHTVAGWVRGEFTTLPNGAKVFYIHELQNDMAQDYRDSRSHALEIQAKYGVSQQKFIDQYAEKFALAPQLTSTDRWVGAQMRAVMRYAADNGATYIALSSAKEQVETQGWKQDPDTLKGHREGAQAFYGNAEGKNSAVSNPKAPTAIVWSVLNKQTKDWKPEKYETLKLRPQPLGEEIEARAFQIKSEWRGKPVNFFSTAMPETFPELEELTAQVSQLGAMGEVKINSRKMVNGLRRMGRALTTIQQLAFANKDVAGLQYQNKIAADYQSYKARLEVEATKVSTHWSTLGKEQSAKLGKFLQDEYELGKHWAGLEKQGTNWKFVATEEFALTARQYGLQESTAQLALQVKQSMLKHVNALEYEMLRKAQQRYEPGSRVLKMKITEILQTFGDIRNQPFLPQTRFGEFGVQVFEYTMEGEELVHQEFFQTEKQRDEAVGLLQKKLGRSKHRVEAKNWRSGAQSYKNVPPEILATVAKELNLSEGQQGQLLAMLDRSRESKIVRGFSRELARVTGRNRDLLRNYADFMQHDSNMLAKLRYRAEFDRAGASVEAEIAFLDASPVKDSAYLQNRQRLELILQYMQEHKDYLMNPPQEFQGVKSLVVLWQLWGVVKTALANATAFIPLIADVTAHFGTVHGGKHVAVAGAKTTAQALGYVTRAAKRSLRMNTEGASKVLTPDEQWAVDRAQTNGLLDQTFSAQLANFSNAGVMQRLMGSQANNYFQLAKRAGMMPLHLVELYTRHIAFLTKFRIYKEAGLPNEKAYEFATEETRLTMGDSSKINRAPFMRGKAAPFTIYYGFTQLMLYMFSGQYEKGFHDRSVTLEAEGYGVKARTSSIGGMTTRMWLMYLVMGGAMGAPGAEDLKAVLRMVAQKFFGTDFDLDRELRKFIVETTAGAEDYGLQVDPNLFMHGLSHNIAGFDLSGSVGFGRIIPGLSTLGDSSGEAIDTALAGAGPLGGFVSGLIRAATDERPSLLAQVMPALPSAARNAATAMQWAKDGARYRNGAKITRDLETGEIRDLTTGELIGKGVGGFNPTVIAQNREQHYATADAKMYWVEKKSQLMANFAEAVQQKDREAIADTTRAIGDYNKNCPPGMQMSSTRIRQSLKARLKQSAMSESGAEAQKSSRALAAETEKLY